MRAATLIPLLALIAGVGAVELMSLRTLSAERSQMQLSLLGAEAAGTNRNGGLQLAAVRMHLSPEGISAERVSGEISTDEASHSFTADRISRPAGEGQQVTLEGNVRIAAGENNLSTYRAVVSDDGTLRGGEVAIDGPQGTAIAQSFSVGADSELELSGGVVATLRRDRLE